MRERGNKFLRKIDKYIGIPLIFLLGILRIRRKLKAAEKSKDDPNIVLIKTAGIGDTILLSAIAAELKNRYHRARITLICAHGNSSIADLIPGIDRKIVFDITQPFHSLMNVRRSGVYDFLFDFGPWPKLNSFISHTAKASFKIGFRRRKACRHFIYDAVIGHSDEVHELDNYRNLLRCIDIEPANLSPRLAGYENGHETRQNVFSPDKYNVVIHPFPAGVHKEFKKWPVPSWIRVAKRLSDRGCRILISGSIDDAAEAAYLESEIKKAGGDCLSVAGRCSLDRMAALLQKCDLLISVNTGIMHLAAAVGTNIVALHGPTSPKRWGPLAENAVILAPQIPCAPCLSLGFEYNCKSGGCMQNISEEEVLSAAGRFLGQEYDIRTTENAAAIVS